MTGRKSEKCLELEKDSEREFLTVKDAVPELSIIAREKNLNLTNTKDFKEAVRIMDMKNLNR